MTQPSHTAPPAPADHTLLFSHNPPEMQKWGAKLSTGMAAAQGGGLSSLSVFPRGRNSLGSLSCQPTRGPAETRCVCKLSPCSHVLWSWIHPSPARGFQQVFYLHNTSLAQPEAEGKMCP